MKFNPIQHLKAFLLLIPKSKKMNILKLSKKYILINEQKKVASANFFLLSESSLNCDCFEKTQTKRLKALKSFKSFAFFFQHKKKPADLVNALKFSVKKFFVSFSQIYLLPSLRSLFLSEDSSDCKSATKKKWLIN